MGISQKPIVVVGAMLPFITGCLVVVADDGEWQIGRASHKATATEERTLDAAGLAALEVSTHNGTIDFTGQDAGPASVAITREGRGRSEQEAQEALDAIEVYVESSGGTTRMGWKWREPRNRRWQGEVSFAIRAPRKLKLDAETHNGEITIRSIEGEVRAESHNGEINVNASGGDLTATSHNGAIDATYAGPSVTLETHNGEVVADLSRCGEVKGSVTTHNGGVRVSVGKATSTAVSCSSSNGTVEAEVPLANVQKSRGRLSGTLGSGAGKLDVTTHNGQIRLRSPLPE